MQKKLLVVIKFLTLLSMIFMNRNMLVVCSLVLIVSVTQCIEICLSIGVGVPLKQR